MNDQAIVVVFIAWYSLSLTVWTDSSRSSPLIKITCNTLLQEVKQIELMNSINSKQMEIKEFLFIP